MLVDEGKVVAAKAAQQGVPVVWEQWEAMLHCFAMFLEGLEAGKRVFKDWVPFCDAVGGGKSQTVKTRGTWFAAKTGKEKEMDVQALSLCGKEELKEKMNAVREARSEGKEGERRRCLSLKYSPCLVGSCMLHSYFVMLVLSSYLKLSKFCCRARRMISIFGRALPSLVRGSEGSEYYQHGGRRQLTI